MNRFLIFFIAFFFVACTNNNGKNENRKTIYVDSSNKAIDIYNKVIDMDTDITKSIEKKCAKINLDSDYDTLEVDNNDGKSAEGGEILLYKKKSQIIKAVEKYYGETGITTYEYYFDNKKLIFIYRLSKFFHSKYIIENKLYFNDDNLIKSETNDTTPKDTSDDMVNSGINVPNLLEEVKKFDTLK